MPEDRIEFVVDGVVEGERLTVIGRCGDVPIGLGSCFDAVYRLRPCLRPVELERDPVRLVEQSASLRVVGIRAYGRDFPVLGQGTTGSLALEGVGTNLVGPGWVLGRRAAVPAEVAHPAPSLATGAAVLGPPSPSSTLDV